MLPIPSTLYIFAAFPTSDGAAIEMRDGDDEDLERAAANLGINLSRNESASVEDLA